VSTYAAGHGLVELACALQVAWLAGTSGQAGALILVYNMGAFLGPLVMATFVPTALRRAWPTATGQLALAGTVVAAAGTLLAGQALLGVTLLGLGNGAYHLAAGTATLRLPDRPVAAVGIFEGPGALGRVTGLVLGMGPLASYHQGLWRWALAALVLAVGLITLRPGTLTGWQPPQPTSPPSSRLTDRPELQPPDRTDQPEASARTAQPMVQPVPTLGLVLLGLAALSVLRAMTGDAVTPASNTGGTLLVAGLVLCLGRCAGGVLAERFGLAKVAAIGFAAACIALLINPAQPWAMAAALLALGVPMAPILGAMARCLPGNEPLAFGCAQVFQLAGAWLAFAGTNHLVLAVVVASCALIAPLVLQPVRSPLLAGPSLPQPEATGQLLESDSTPNRNG